MKQVLWVSLTVALGAMTVTPAWADCAAEQQNAMAMLAEAKQKTVVEGGSIERGPFEKKFKQVINRMVAQQCLNEIMQLNQYVMAEQQKYPAR
ncbi:MAG: hypothetical protein KTR14_00965 [Vampirovibrio sp.]|nr:hypothetical protein [Vampirovibrio sp.]